MISFSFAEMFSGIGGFRFGLEKTNQEKRLLRQSDLHKHSTDSDELREHKGQTSSRNKSEESNHNFRCIWANDFDKYASRIYRRHFGEKELIESDIRTIDEKTVPDHDLLTAGFPCQSFSLAGKRKGFQDNRGTLFHEIVRIAGIKKPKLLLLENVKGLLSNDDGKTFGTILEELGNIGYWVEWQTLNSKHFGVPQNRERVFIVGHLRDGGFKQIFPIREAGKISCRKDGSEQAFEKGIRSGNISLAQTLEATYGKTKSLTNCVASALSHRYGKDGSENLIQTGNLYENKADAGRVYDSDGLARSLKGQAGGLGGKTGLYSQEQRIRRLTPIECERLQGFPDGWTAKGLTKEGQEIETSDTQRYKLLGNAVTTNVVSFLGTKILECLIND